MQLCPWTSRSHPQRIAAAPRDGMGLGAAPDGGNSSGPAAPWRAGAGDDDAAEEEDEDEEDEDEEYEDEEDEVEQLEAVRNETGHAFLSYQRTFYKFPAHAPLHLDELSLTK